MRNDFGERVAAWKLADASAQASAAMQRDERACGLMQKILRGKILQRRFFLHCQSEGAPG